MNEYEPGFSESIASSFAEGGVWMYPVALLGCVLVLASLICVILGVISTTNQALPLAIVLLVLAVLPPGISAIGVRLGRANVETIMATVNEDDRATIRAACEAELLNLTLAGLSASLIPSVLGCVLLGLGLSRLHRFRTSPT